MLVTFACEAHENITMFGDIAAQLLHLMGHSGTVPGAILADDVPAALEQLQNALAHKKNKPATSLPASDDEEEPEISLSHRAVPLIGLLQAAIKNQCNVMWFH